MLINQEEGFTASLALASLTAMASAEGWLPQSLVGCEFSAEFK